MKIFKLLSMLLMMGSAHSSASSSTYGHSWIANSLIILFFIGYSLVIAEEKIHLKKSISMLVTGSLMWLLLIISQTHYQIPINFNAEYDHIILEFTHLFLFLFVAMTYINVMTERQIFNKLRERLVSVGFTYKQLFWITGFLAFFISPIADNLTTALLMGAVVIAVGKEYPHFIKIGCINIVVAANAGGAFCPFGDITTLMIWQKGILPFTSFFKIFIPSLVNFYIPALLMSYTLNNTQPYSKNDSRPVQLKPFSFLIIILFLVTIALAVLGQHFFKLSPTVGMMAGLTLLMALSFYSSMNNKRNELPVFKAMEKIEWDTMFFFYGIIMCVGILNILGLLQSLSYFLYSQLGYYMPIEHHALPANILVGLISAIVDNIPVMVAILKMKPALSEGHWLLVTLTAGVGGSLLSIGSAAGVALMGQARQYYNFLSHLKWSWAIFLGYIASIICHIWLNSSAFTV